MWQLSVYLHMFTMYGDYLNMWLLHNIKTMQIYKFTHNPVLLLFVHEPDRVSGRFIANSLINLVYNTNIFYICRCTYIQEFYKVQQHEGIYISAVDLHVSCPNLIEMTSTNTQAVVAVTCLCRVTLSHVSSCLPHLHTSLPGCHTRPRTLLHKCTLASDRCISCCLV